MSKILVTQNTMHGMDPTELVNILSRELEEWQIEYAGSFKEARQLIGDASVVVGGDFPPELLDYADQLNLFACTWAGIDHVDIESLSDQDVVVTNASGVHGPNIAEHVLGWFLAISRGFAEAIQQQKKREWRHIQSIGELNNSRVCVVGLGQIGKTIVDRLSGFDIETIGVRYTPEKGGPTDEIFGYEDVIDGMNGADYVAVACPLTEETRGLIGRRELTALSSNAVLVNVARGPVIDTDALVWTLQKDIIHAAALDVTDPEPLPQDHPLWSLDNCYLTPHNAGHTPYYWNRIADLLSHNLQLVRETGEWNNLQNQII